MKLSSREKLLNEAEKELSDIRLRIREADEKKAKKQMENDLEKAVDKATGGMIKTLHGDLDRKLAAFEKKMKKEQANLEKEKNRIRKETKREPRPEELSWYQRRKMISRNIVDGGFNENSLFHRMYLPVATLISYLPSVYITQNDPSAPGGMWYIDRKTGAKMSQEELYNKLNPVATTPSKMFWRVLLSLFQGL